MIIIENIGYKIVTLKETGSLSTRRWTAKVRKDVLEGWGVSLDGSPKWSVVNFVTTNLPHVCLGDIMVYEFIDWIVDGQHKCNQRITFENVEEL